MNFKQSINNLLKKYKYEIRKIHNGFSMNNDLRWLIEYKFDTILDVGANDGQFARFIKTYFPESNLYSFEPIKKCFDEIQEKCKNLKKFKSFNYALGQENKSEKFFLNDFNPSSSLLNISETSIEHFPFTKNQNEIIVEVKRLDDIIGGLDVSGKVLIKIDVQGYEKNVLHGALEFLSKGEKMVIIEVSIKKLYDNEPDFNEIYEMMYSMGFKFFGTFDQLYSPKSGEILQMDAIFYRK